MKCARILRLSVFAVSLSAIGSWASASPILYGVDNTDRNGSRTLVTIDQSTAALTNIGPIGTTFSAVSGMVYDPITDTLYATGGPFVPGDFNTNLLTINRGSGAATAIGETMHDDPPIGANGNITDLARRSSDGQLFAFAPTSDPTAGTPNRIDVLMSLDTNTGLATLVGQTGLGPDGSLGQDPAGNGLAFDLSGNLLHADQFSLNSADPVTGSITLGIALDFTGPFFDANEEFARVNAMDIHPDTGEIYVSVTTGTPSDPPRLSYLAILDPNTGTFDYIGAMGVRVDAIAFADVPEPATLTLLSLAIAGLGFARRRIGFPTKKW